MPWCLDDTAPNAMLVLLDRSRSMSSELAGGGTRAEMIADGLRSFVETEVEIGMAAFGLAAFPSPACPAGGDGDAGVCTPANANGDIGGIADDAPLGPFAQDNYEAIDSALAAIGTCGETPLCGSLEWALDHLTGAAFPADLEPAGRSVLLLTDGAPNCDPEADIGTCASSDPDAFPTVTASEQCLDDACAFAAASALCAAGIDVFIVGIGDSDAFGDTWQGIAYFGACGEEASAPASPQYWYPGDTATALEGALESIAHDAFSCVWTLPWDEIPDVTEEGYVVEKACDKINILGIDASGSEQMLCYDPECTAGGWYWRGIDASAEDLDGYNIDECDRVELCPEACDNLVDQTWTSLTTEIGCAPPTGE